jgi:dolichol-phosphate mannosyltransferase
LYLILYAGIFFTLAGIVIAGKAIIDKLNGVALDGFTTVILTTLITGGVIIFSVGLLSTYVAKIFEEVKRRPQYIVDRQIEISCSNSTPPLEAGNRQLSSKIQANEQ